MVLVVEILNNKSTYNTLELTSGRMAKVARGDVVVGALGHRKALFGYSGHIPDALKPGDVIQMLNIGGVLGICDSATPDKGKPFDCKVLGRRADLPLSRRAHRRHRADRLQAARLWRRARCARRAGGRARRDVHGGRQDGRRVRHHCAHAPPRPHRRCLQGHRRLTAPRHPGLRGFGRAADHDFHRPWHRHDHRALRTRPSPAAC